MVNALTLEEFFLKWFIFIFIFYNKTNTKNRFYKYETTDYVLIFVITDMFFKYYFYAKSIDS